MVPVKPGLGAVFGPSSGLRERAAGLQPTLGFRRDGAAT
jgi:hypothetical protein